MPIQVDGQLALRKLKVRHSADARAGIRNGQVAGDRCFPLRGFGTAQIPRLPHGKRVDIKAVQIQRQLLLDEDHREQIVLIRRIVLQHLDSIAIIGRLQRRRQRPPRRRSPPPSPGWTSSPEGSATTCSCCPSSVTDSSSAHAAVGSRLNAITRHMNRLMMRFFMLLSPLP